jgi:hypothetical protein
MTSRYYFSYLVFISLAFGQRPGGNPPRKASTQVAQDVLADLDLPKAEKLLWDRNLAVVG